MIKINTKHTYTLGIILCLFLVIVETFRDGTINPDFDLYLQYIIYPNSYKGDAEASFFKISEYTYLFGGNYLTVFFIYAILGISIKLYAIYRFSINIIYSICVWMSFSFILHDLIQIRAAVAAALLLLMIPFVVQKKYWCAVSVWIIAIAFHNSALIFGFLFLLKKDTIRPWIWIGMYSLIFIINIVNYPIFSLIFKIIALFPSSLADRIGRSDPNVLNELPRMTMYSRYVLIPAIFCLFALCYRKKLISISPYSLVCLKSCFIGLYFYGIGLPIVSERVFELLSVPYILLVPTSLFWFNKNSMIKGKVVITLFCLFMAWNLLFKQEVFS